MVVTLKQEQRVLKEGIKTNTLRKYFQILIMLLSYRACSSVALTFGHHFFLSNNIFVNTL